MSEARQLPAWAEDLRRRYLRDPRPPYLLPVLRIESIEDPANEPPMVSSHRDPFSDGHQLDLQPKEHVELSQGRHDAKPRPLKRVERRRIDLSSGEASYFL